MDDKRFDSITRLFASGASRRTLVKGLLGLGGATLTGGVVLDNGEAEAARRPTPTPKPVTCPGQQTWNGTKCVCPAGLSQCVPNGGPDCCNDQLVSPGTTGYSTCCDNACCQGSCTSEEICCPTNSRPGGLPPTNRVCDVAGREECCLYSDECCTVDGCCATTCYGGSDGESYCCDTANYCPGGSESEELCCTGDTPIKCACGTNNNVCIADTDAACCVDSDCDTPPSGSSPCAVGTCTNNVCSYTDCNSESEICCPDNQGVYACRVGDECCLSNQDCADTCEACVNFVCVDDPNTFPCGPASDPEKYCCPETNYSICCGASQYECCGVDSATGVTRECDADGKCCEAGTPNFCAGSNTCCSAPCVTFGEAEYCCPPGRGRVCPGASEFVCCPNGQECSDDGACCPAGTVACGDECCPVDNICCPVTATVPAPIDGECCPSIGQCNTLGVCCPAGSLVCDDNCCSGDTPQCCNGECVAADVECCSADKPCDGECEVCVNGACEDQDDLCPGECGVCVNGSCQSDETLCLACEACQFDPQLDSFVCVNECTGCAECQATRQAPGGVCVPLDTECLSCQICDLDEGGAGGTCIDDCQGCGNCIAGDAGTGTCVADNAQCPETEVCCVDGQGVFACEDGPYCGCDNDQQCSSLNNPAECKVGVCNLGTCETGPAPDTTVCHQAGSGNNATCDPAVTCNGDDQSCPTPPLPPVGTDCGACLECNGQGLCLDKCTDSQQCCQFAQPVGDVCIPDGETCCDSAEACGVDCEVCNLTLHYCVSDCGEGEKCCPGTDNCVPQRRRAHFRRRLHRGLRSLRRGARVLRRTMYCEQPNCCPGTPDFCVLARSAASPLIAIRVRPATTASATAPARSVTMPALLHQPSRTAVGMSVTGNECCATSGCTNPPDACHSAACTDGTASIPTHAPANVVRTASAPTL